MRFNRLAPAASLACALLGGVGVHAADTPLESRESRYNNIYIYQRGDIVSMVFGHNRRLFTESEFDRTDEMRLPVAYTRTMTVALAYVDGHASLLEIGGGGGRISWYLYKSLPDARVTSVELDEAVAELARKYFGVSEQERYSIAIADGRRYLMRQPPGAYDVILIDAYRGPFVPFHLLTREFFHEAKARLRPGGVIAQNIEPSTMVFDSAVATIRSVFDHVDLYDAQGNIVLVAYDGPPKDQAGLRQRAEALQTQYHLTYPLTDYLRERRIVDRAPEVEVLTDDFAPVEALRAIEVHNRKLDGISSPAP